MAQAERMIMEKVNEANQRLTGTWKGSARPPPPSERAPPTVRASVPACHLACHPATRSPPQHSLTQAPHRHLEGVSASHPLLPRASVAPTQYPSHARPAPTLDQQQRLTAPWKG